MGRSGAIPGLTQSAPRLGRNPASATVSGARLMCYRYHSTSKTISRQRRPVPVLRQPRRDHRRPARHARARGNGDRLQFRRAHCRGHATVPRGGHRPIVSEEKTVVSAHPSKRRALHQYAAATTCCCGLGLQQPPQPRHRSEAVEFVNRRDELICAGGAEDLRH